jgi:tetratricopeptide (TPR) repeat protein
VLNATDRPDTAALLRTARRFGVTASGLAYVVLETPYDYAQAEIEPPASLGTDARNAYRRIAADLAQQKQREREGRLQRVVDAWNVHKRWWADPMAARRLDEQRATYESRFPPPPPPVPLMAPPPTVVPQAVMAPPPPIQPRASAPAPDGPLPEEAVQDVVVTGARLGRDSVIADSAAAGPQATTTTATAPDPSRPYLRALEAAPSDRLAAVLREQERRHGDTPAFYFDVAEWLHGRGRTDEARFYLTNALELPTADVRTLAIVADRMAKYGDYDRAVWAQERALSLLPDLPQARRNLALALIARAERPAATATAQRADYARALDLLTEVVLTPWESAYDGIGLISLTEANRIIPRLRRLGGTVTLDPRLIALLDVDLRVTLDWSTEATNLNLSVEEPGGERAFPGMRVTANGGRVSNDISAGYGPEEYQVRRAAAGAHAVRVQTLSTDRLDPNGPITVRARVYRNWGRASETLEEFNLELRPGEDAADRVITRLALGSPEPRR